MIIRPAASIRGLVPIPGDKSISHRAAMIAALAEGETRIENFAASEDCASTLRCLEALGVLLRREGGKVVVGGRGLRGFRAPADPLDCGNSGTTMRLLAGILAGAGFDSVLTGDDSLRKRPMGRVIDPLTAMGGKISSSDGRAPLHIEGQRLAGISFEMPVASAQLKSCLLLAGLNAEGETVVVENTPTRDHTERMLQQFGAELDVRSVEKGNQITIRGGQTLAATDIFVPGDVSSAAFFIVTAACLEGSEVKFSRIGLNPTRTAFLALMRELGCRIDVRNETEVNNEPVGDLTVRGGLEKTPESRSAAIGGQIVANLIDEIPILAVFATQLEHGLEIRDAAELRIKESDRIATTVENLKLMGADVEEFPDGLRVKRSDLHGAAVDSFGDHRIAMAFAIAGLLAKGETDILNAQCSDVSFPGFFDILSNVAIR